MSVRTLAILSVVFFFTKIPLHSQQLDCTVKVNYESVPSTNKDLLRDFEAELKEYLNNHTWGQDDPGEKIKCTFDIFIQSVVGENRYSAQVFLGSQRAVYGSEKSTAVVRLKDDAWDFTYVRNRPISHNTYSFNDLASFLDFYVYIVLGYDYDSYKRLSGTRWFQMASDVASLGRSSGVRGWDFSKSAYSRAQLIDELLSPKFAPFRAASHTYHFTGLDSLKSNVAAGHANLLKAIEAIGKAKQNVDPQNIVIKAFFDTKYPEIADLFRSYPDKNVYLRLGRIDPSHQLTYEKYRTQ